MRMWDGINLPSPSEQAADMALSPIRAMVAGLSSVPQGTKLKDELAVWHGTTIASFFAANRAAIISVSDGKASEGPTLYPASLDFQKVVEIDSRTIMLFAGAAGLASMHAKSLRNWVETMERVREEGLSTRAKVNMLSRMLREGMALASLGLIVISILATWDIKKGGRIFLIGPDGTSVLKSDYAIHGSGRIGEGLLLKAWHPNLTVDEGVDLAKELITTNAQKLDSGTGGRIQIKVLTAQGVTTIDGGRANG